MEMRGEDFNAALELFYQHTLKKRHMAEAVDVFQKELARLDSWKTWREGRYNRPLLSILKGQSAIRFLSLTKHDFLQENIPEASLRKLIQLCLLIIEKKATEAGKMFSIGNTET